MHVFHYCGVSSFFNVVASGELWATHVNNMDDPDECLWILDDVEQWADGLVATNAHRHVRIVERSRSIAKHLTDQVAHMRGLARQHYAACFSKTHTTLSQWRHYADDCAGFVLEVDLASTGFGLIRTTSGTIVNGAGYAEVSYGAHEQLPYRQRLEEGIAAAPDPDEHVGGSWPAYWDHVYGPDEDLGAMLYSRYPFTKNPAYAEEAEVRLVFSENMSLPDGWYAKGYRLLRDRLAAFRRISAAQAYRGSTGQRTQPAVPLRKRTQVEEVLRSTTVR